VATVENFEDHCWQDVVPAADMKLYAKFTRETFVGPAPALVAIDLYNSVYRGGAKPPSEIDGDFPNTCGIYAHAAIAPTQRLFAAARRAKLPVFYSTGDERTLSRPPGAQATRRQGRQTRPDDYEIHEAFEPHSGDVVLYKQRASVFHGTPILSHLSLLGVRSLIVCGESTSGCVRASVVDAYSSGFHVTLVEECTFDRAELTHKVNLFDLHHKYADVMHLDEVEAHLAGQSPARP
jgi:nicotinamidase-related amidase